MGRRIVPTTKLAMTSEQHHGLNKIVSRHTTGQQASKRAKILLLGSEGKAHSVISQELGVSVNTVKSWRNRWKEASEELYKLERGKEMEQCLLLFLKDLPRSGTPAKFTATQKQQIVALACDRPINHQLEMTDWTYQMLALTAQTKGIVDSISESHVRLILKNAAIATTQERVLAVSKN